MLRGAIFDMDGTLLDSMSVWETLGAEYLRSKGVDPPPGLRAALKPLSMRQTAVLLRERFGIRGSDERIIAEINGRVERFYLSEAALKPGAADFLRRLTDAGARMCVATATDRYMAEAALARCGVLGRFDFLLTVTETGAGKERPDIFERALERLGAAKADTLVFEDSPHAIRTAAAAGFRVAAIPDPSAFSEPGAAEALALAERIIENYDECEVADL